MRACVLFDRSVREIKLKEDSLDQIKHVSFDMWGTLIDPNPEYGEERARLLVEISSLPKKTIAALYTAVKSGIDAATETSYGHVSACPFALLSQLIVRMHDSLGTMRHLKKSYITDDLEEAFSAAALKYPPIVRPSVIPLLKRLREKGITVSITSNTNFVVGAVLQTLVDEWDSTVAFSLYSDEVKFSKPDRAIFNLLYRDASKLHDGGLAPDEILHVGDNTICDIEGAQNCGMQTRLVRNELELWEFFASLFKQ